MKNTIKVLGFAALVAVIGFAAILMIGCPASDDDETTPVAVATSASDSTVTIKAIEGVTAPETGGIPVTTVTETEEFTGTVSWFPPVHGTFAASTHYMALITLKAKSGYTLNGVEEDFFTVTGATANNAVDSGSVSAVFPTTAGTPEHPAVIDIAEIDGVTYPVSGGTPVKTIIETAQFTGTVEWINDPTTFAEGTAYTAIITLTAKAGYTLNGVEADFFTVVGAITSNAVDSGSVIAEFPATGSTPVFGIILSVIGSPSFGTVAQGYTSASPVLTVHITNIGDHATGPLTVSLSGTGANAFTLSAVSINSIVTEGMSSFNVRRKSGLAEEAYEATVTVSGGNGISESFDVQFIVTALPYVITGSGDKFTAKRGDTVIGTANQPIQDVIDGIRSNADGGIAAIQFGSGADALDIGAASITFSNTTEETWGTVTLLGKITSSVSSATGGTIIISDPVSLTSVADIANTAATNGRAVYLNSTGTVSIFGGTVSATTGIAIRNASTGKIAVSGTAKVISANVTSGEATILIANNGTATGPRLEISGGTVENIGDNTSNATAVYNASTGTVNISGGAVSASSGRAVYNNTTGTINISGGSVSSVNSYTVYNNADGGVVNISGGTVSSESAYTVYNYGNGSMLNISGGTVSSEWSHAVYSYTTSAGGGKATISGGTISSLTGSGVYNYSNGEVIITGGKVSSLTSIGLYNYSTGTVTISGGTVSARNNAAIANNSTGKITISGDALVTSANAIISGQLGTIFFYASGTLEIQGGRVENTSGSVLGYSIYAGSSSGSGTIKISGGTVKSTGSGYGIYNASTASVTISGGTVSSETYFAINNYGAGTVTISGGTVSSTTSRAVSNNAAGMITISGGTVSTTTGSAVYNNSTGTVIISGGTVSATTGYAAYNYSTGKITVSQDTETPTLVTSANVTETQATIFIASSGTATDPRFEMRGGTVANTSTTTGNAIRNNSTGAVNITGGTVSKAGEGNYAVYKSGNGTVTIDSAVEITGNNFGL